MHYEVKFRIFYMRASSEGFRETAIVKYVYQHLILLPRNVIVDVANFLHCLFKEQVNGGISSGSAAVC